MKDDCRRFEANLEAFLDGRLSPGETRAAREHILDCANCRELVEIAGGAGEAPPELAADVLERTSGSPCDHARQALCEYVDGQADAVATELMRMHLSGCEACSALANVLVELSADLPALAQLDPGESFTAGVLALTLPSPVERPGWIDRARQGWTRLVRRPRFALEGAYVMTLLLLVALGVPGALLAGAPTRLALTARHEIASPVQESVVGLRAEVSEHAQRALDATESKLSAEARATADGMTSYTTQTIDKLKISFGTFWTRLASRQTNDDENGSPSSGDDQDGDAR
jgi:anti-sigma factor RsiW